MMDIAMTWLLRGAIISVGSAVGDHLDAWNTLTRDILSGFFERMESCSLIQLTGLEKTPTIYRSR
jgi:hypothetical protein